MKALIFLASQLSKAKRIPARCSSSLSPLQCSPTPDSQPHPVPLPAPAVSVLLYNTPGSWRHDIIREECALGCTPCTRPGRNVKRYSTGRESLLHSLLLTVLGAAWPCCAPRAGSSPLPSCISEGFLLEAAKQPSRCESFPPMARLGCWPKSSEKPREKKSTGGRACSLNGRVLRGPRAALTPRKAAAANLPSPHHPPRPAGFNKGEQIREATLGWMPFGNALASPGLLCGLFFFFKIIIILFSPAK